MHWHGDTFDLPKGAKLLASSELYNNQAFAYGKNILALQFHPEITELGMEKWYIGHANELSTTKHITIQQLRTDTKKFSSNLLSMSQMFFKNWLNTLNNQSNQS